MRQSCTLGELVRPGVKGTVRVGIGVQQFLRQSTVHTGPLLTDVSCATAHKVSTEQSVDSRVVSKSCVASPSACTNHGDSVPYHLGALKAPHMYISCLLIQGSRRTRQGGVIQSFELCTRAHADSYIRSFTTGTIRAIYMCNVHDKVCIFNTTLISRSRGFAVLVELQEPSPLSDHDKQQQTTEITVRFQWKALVKAYAPKRQNLPCMRAKLIYVQGPRKQTSYWMLHI